MYVYIYPCLYTHIHRGINKYIHIHICVCTMSNIMFCYNICVHVYNPYIFTHLCVYIYMYAYTYLCMMCIHPYAYIYISTHVYTCIYTYQPKDTAVLGGASGKRPFTESLTGRRHDSHRISARCTRQEVSLC